MKHGRGFSITIIVIPDKIAGILPERGGIMKILIADDQADVLNALKVLLEQQDGHFIIDEAEDMNSLLTKVEEMKPDILLLDWELSNRDMADVVPEIRRLAKDIRIVAMSVSPEAESMAKYAGADAFVSKGDNSDMLLSVICMIR
jgi:two-component system response regulator DesR